MDDVDRQIEELARAEQAQHDIGSQLRELRRYAGRWVEGEQLFVGIVGLSADAAVTFKPAKHTLGALEALARRLAAAADRLGATLSDYGVSHRENAVIARLERFDDERSLALRAEFAGEPIDWRPGESPSLAHE